MFQSQTGSFGVLPSPQLPNTFVTQGFDAGEPMGDANWNLGAKYSRSYGMNTPYSMGGCDDGPAHSWGGEVPFTPFFMGEFRLCGSLDSVQVCA